MLEKNPFPRTQHPPPNAYIRWNYSWNFLSISPKMQQGVHPALLSTSFLFHSFAGTSMVWLCHAYKTTLHNKVKKRLVASSTRARHLGGKRVTHRNSLISGLTDLFLWQLWQTIFATEQPNTLQLVLLVEYSWGNGKGILECGNGCFPSRMGPGGHPYSAAYTGMPLSPIHASAASHCLL